MKILLVEDDTSLNRLICYRLEKEGYQVKGCYMASELVDCYKAESPDLLLLDYTLPDMNGKELVEVLQELNYNTPFVIITGHSDIQLAIDLMKMGALDFVVKDESFQDVLPVVLSRVSKNIKVKNEMEKAKLRLVKNEALYRNTVNQIPDPIIYYYQDNVYFINHALESKLGYTLEELQSNDFRKVIQDRYFRQIDEWISEVEDDTVFPVFEMEMENREGLPQTFLVKAIKSRFENKTSIMVVFSDITEKKHFEALMMKSILDTEERERIRFARDLHDELGPVLSGVKLYTDILGKEGKTREEILKLKTKITELVDVAVQTSRNLSSNLIPSVLLDFGLNTAIQGFIDQISQGVETQISFESNLNERLEQNVEITLFRVFKELINNSLKHAMASCVEIQIFYSKTKKLKLFYEDNGVGFNLEEKKNDISLKSAIE
jgi:PAS domain S-box-containing protein